jgi:type VI secretion system protein ImpA
MGDLHGLDCETLRQPLSDEAPAGIDLRVDEAGRAAWSRVRELRDEARRIEREADNDPRLDRRAAEPTWNKLAAACVEILTQQSHDLAAAATLTEALSRTCGFQGLAASFDAARSMVESHWSNLYPIPDPEDGPADERTTSLERALPLVRLAGEESEGLLVPAILNVPLLDGRGGERYGLFHYRSSREIAGIEDPERLANAIERGATSPQLFEAAVASTEKRFLQETFRGIVAAKDSWQRLADAVGTASGDTASVPKPPIVDLFEECETALRTFAAAAIAEIDAVASNAERPTGETQTSPHAASTPPSGLLVPGGASRHDVLAILDSVADYFERHDPHSLLAAQVRNVVRMARLPRPDYYREIILEEGGLKSVSRMVGLNFDDAS